MKGIRRKVLAEEEEEEEKEKKRKRRKEQKAGKAEVVEESLIAYEENLRR